MGDILKKIEKVARVHRNGLEPFDFMRNKTNPYYWPNLYWEQIKSVNLIDQMINKKGIITITIDLAEMTLLVPIIFVGFTSKKSKEKSKSHW